MLFVVLFFWDKIFYGLDSRTQASCKQSQQLLQNFVKYKKATSFIHFALKIFCINLHSCYNNNNNVYIHSYYNFVFNILLISLSSPHLSLFILIPLLLFFFSSSKQQRTFLQICPHHLTTTTTHYIT